MNIQSALTISVIIIGHFRVLMCLFQIESKCKIFHIQMSSACSFIFKQIKVIFIRMVSHLDAEGNSEWPIMVTVCVRPAVHTAPSDWMQVYCRSDQPPGLARNDCFTTTQ